MSEKQFHLGPTRVRKTTERGNMFKVLYKDFIREPVLEMDVTAPTDEIELFGKKYTMYADDWKKHIHLKCTNRCDANCPFCIERSTRNDSENWEWFMDSAILTMRQMQEQGHLRTVSITGGEPTTCPDLQRLIDTVNSFHPMLFSINTNGSRLAFAKADTFRGWLNISKHAIDDSAIFRRRVVVDRDCIRLFKLAQPDAKVRLQCVLGVDGGLKTLNDILNFMTHFKDSVDDFSFRSLIVDTDYDMVPQLFNDLRNFLFDRMVEQAIQDYYVYEVFDYGGKKVTLSWSNMFMLRQYNETHPFSNFLEEIIVHPDGVVSGSWNKRSLVIRSDWPWLTAPIASAPIAYQATPGYRVSEGDAVAFSPRLHPLGQDLIVGVDLADLVATPGIGIRATSGSSSYTSHVMPVTPNYPGSSIGECNGACLSDCSDCGCSGEA